MTKDKVVVGQVYMVSMGKGVMHPCQIQREVPALGGWRALNLRTGSRLHIQRAGRIYDLVLPKVPEYLREKFKLELWWKAHSENDQRDPFVSRGERVSSHTPSESGVPRSRGWTAQHPVRLELSEGN